jgi:predicted nucleic acid-binding protein
MLETEVDPIMALWRRYEDVPMSPADACLVRLAEVHSGSAVCTTASDFSVYRVQRNRAIPLIHPTLP